jgi:SAM-dependent methyltransferase
MSETTAATASPADSAETAPTCPVCGSARAALLEPVEGWGAWYTCGDCTLEFVQPLVLPVTPQELYGAAYRGERTENSMREFNDRLRQRRAIVDKDPTLWFWSPAFGRIVEWLHGRVGRGGKVFEVGCGLGFFMHSLRREGFDVEGLDVAEKPVELNRSDGFRVWHGEVHTVPDDWVDPEAVVCMFMLHHVVDPIAFLSAIRTRWPRAALAIAQYGPSNQGNPAANPPRTLTRWSARSLETALARAGYARVEAGELAGTGNEAALLRPVRKVMKQSIRLPGVYRFLRRVEHRVVARVARPLAKPGYVVLAFAEPLQA